VSAGWPVLLAGYRPAASYTHEPLERGGGHYRAYTTLILGLSVQTRARVFHALPGARASPASQHAITSARPTLLVRLLLVLPFAAAAPLQQARVSVQHRKGAPWSAASSHPHDRVFA
jgi:hypothetical protein